MCPCNQSGARAARNLPALEQPPGAIRIEGDPRWIAAQPAVHLLDHQRVGKTDWPLHAMNGERQRRAVCAMRRHEGHTINRPGHISEKYIDTDVAQSGLFRIQPKVIRRVEEVWHGRRRTRPRQRQKRIAVAIAVAAATRQLRIAERNELGDRGDAAILHADLLEVGALRAGWLVFAQQLALREFRRGTAAATRHPGTVKNQLADRRRVAVLCVTLFQEWAAHGSLLAGIL